VSGTLALGAASVAVLFVVAGLAWRAADRAVARIVETPPRPGPDPGRRGAQRRSSANATPGPLPRV
jgi:hypothetical protein